MIYKTFNVLFSQTRSVLNQSAASGELGLIVGEVALTQSTVVTVELELVGNLVEEQIVGAVVAVVHKLVAPEGPAA